MAEVGRLGPASHPLVIGVDGPLVTIGSVAGSWALNAEQRDDFARLLFAAEHQAETWAEDNQCICGRTTAACAEAGRERRHG